GGVFAQWIHSGYAEFLIVSGRWEEAERVIADVEWTRTGEYIEVSIATIRSQLATYRGQFDEAVRILGGAEEAAVRIGDQQAVLPTLVAVAQAQAGLGNDREALAALRRAMEQSGSIADGSLGSYFLFEAVDLLVGARRRAEAPIEESLLASGAQLLGEYALGLESAAAAGGEASTDGVRRALFGAAVEQLGSLSRSLGLAPPALENGARFSGRLEALPTLDDHHRTFDVARVKLWLAEERPEAAFLADARRTFEELGAHPYIARSSRD
ncbi:MAG: hypothetical protein ABJB65_03850, partial [Chloroflexota bacterium]